MKSWVLFICLAVICNALGAEHEIPPAFGPYVNLTAKDFLDATTFTATNKLVGTYYFYWYDVYSGSHIRNGNGSDALTTHPPTLEDFSYTSVRWHKKQLSDMEAAGIDIALMVFWGSPAEHETNTILHWSFAGLDPLVQAREELLREGHHPPRIGLFYDTSTLENNHWHFHADLTTDFGKKFFFATVRDFFSCIPPKHWAMMDGKPIVLMYASAFAAKWDQGFIDYTKAEFPKEFGGRVPWIAPQDSWNVKGDATCSWGGALAFRNPGIGEIGPGYDHSAVPGRKPLVRDREDGKFYEQSWTKFLRRPSNFVMIETWDEFHEGTDIAESKESGRKYIELTRKYADMFKREEKPPQLAGKFSGANSVSVQLNAANQDAGLRQIECEDGATASAVVAGRDARQVERLTSKARFMYFQVDDSFKSADAMNATLVVDYFDKQPGTLSVEFDGSDLHAPFNGAYSRSANVVKLNGDGQWKSARFELRGAKFLNSQNGGADLRLASGSAELIVSRAQLEH